VACFEGVCESVAVDRGAEGMPFCVVVAGVSSSSIRVKVLAEAGVVRR
jgi:hypothetical protein